MRSRREETKFHQTWHAAALMGKLRGQSKEGRGVLVVLHDLAAAMNHADRVVVLADGVVAADGKPAEALTPDLIGAVWKVSARWLGEPGAKALSI